MFRRLLRLANPEIAFGFVIATVFWIGVLGWQAAYAPSEIEKRQCQEAAHKSGHKSEDCKTLWERTTSDPVAFFTFWLVISTVGLGASTVLLWYAGEKQLLHARRSIAIQSRDMRASIALAEEANKLNRETFFASQRPWLTLDIELQSGFQSDGNTGVVEFEVTVKNVGSVPAVNVVCRLLTFPNQEGGGEISHYSRLSDSMKSHAFGKSFGDLLFPGQVVRFSKQSMTAVWFNENIQTRYEKRQRRIGGGGGIEPLGVCFCVDYMAAVGDRHFQTGFDYTLIKEAKDGDDDNVVFNLETRDIARDELALVRFQTGSHAI
jgi:hypothetical protein